MASLEEYATKYPNLPIEAVLYFEMESGENGLKNKNVISFITQYMKTFNIKEMLQPRIVSKICDVIAALGHLSIMGQQGPDGAMNSYMSVIRGKRIKTDPELKAQLNESLSCKIYGLQYVYATFKESVRALKHIKPNSDISLGSSFLFRDCLVTARHCIEGSASFAVHGFSKSELKDSKILFHEDKAMDLAIITPVVKKLKSLKWDIEGSVLDDVITIGYPQIAGFHNFAVTEKAQVSSRLTATKGEVAAEGEDIWIKKNLLLITAKIKGGNSGGPVISSKGEVVGVSVQHNWGQGAYDDLGYGVVIPIKYVIDDLISGVHALDVSSQYEIIDF